MVTAVATACLFFFLLPPNIENSSRSSWIDVLCCVFKCAHIANQLHLIPLIWNWQCFSYRFSALWLTQRETTFWLLDERQSMSFLSLHFIFAFDEILRSLLYDLNIMISTCRWKLTDSTISISVGWCKVSVNISSHYPEYALIGEFFTLRKP